MGPENRLHAVSDRSSCEFFSMKTGTNSLQFGPHQLQLSAKSFFQASGFFSSGIAIFVVPFFFGEMNLAE
jgi:hypothetical protein